MASPREELAYVVCTYAGTDTKKPDYLATIDVDPKSKTFGQIVQDLPLPGDTVAHHIFYNRDQTKAYITALGKPELRVIDMRKQPLAIKTIAVPDCQVGEDVVFSEDNKRWFLTCMGSQAMIIGEARPYLAALVNVLSAAVTVLMAVLWLTQAIPIAATRRR